MFEHGIENEKVRDALVETRANDMIQYLAKLEITGSEAKEVLWRAERLIDERAREVPLQQILGKLSKRIGAEGE